MITTMKNIIVIICLLCLTNCEPKRINPRDLNYVVLTADVLPYQKFSLGDTLVIRINIPDSLEYGYYGGLINEKKIFVKSVQEMLGGGFIYKFDTINGGVAYFRDDDLNFSSIFVNQFQKRPFYTEQRIIPKTKGIFFAELRYTPAVKIKINNDFEAQLSLIYDDKINRNDALYCKYSLINQLNYPVTQCLNEVGDTKGFYTFKVE